MEAESLTEMNVGDSGTVPSQCSCMCSTVFFHKLYLTLARPDKTNHATERVNDMSEETQYSTTFRARANKS